MLGKWHLVMWKPYRQQLVKPVKPVPQLSSIMSWNDNGFSSKKYMIERVLHDEKVGILLMQETLNNSASSLLRIQGYNSFSIEQALGFHGQATMVHSNLPAYQITHEENYLLHVKIS